MRISLGETLRRLRMEQGFSQQQLADRMHLDRSSIAHWESGRRVPDVVMLSRLSECLGVELSYLMHAAEDLDEPPKIILVDDEKLILNGFVSGYELDIIKQKIIHFTILILECLLCLVSYCFYKFSGKSLC